MTKMTEAQYDELISLSDEFGTALMARLGAKDSSEATRSITVYMSRAEKVKAAFTMLMWNLSKNASPETRAKRHLAHSDSVFPALTKTFGAEVLADAVPSRAKNAEFVDFTRSLGARHLPTLIEKSL